MTKLIRITESEIANLINRSVERIINEDRMGNNRITTAKKLVMRMGSVLNDVENLLRGTSHEEQLATVRNELIRLNEMLTNEIKMINGV